MLANAVSLISQMFIQVGVMRTDLPAVHTSEALLQSKQPPQLLIDKGLVPLWAPYGWLSIK